MSKINLESATKFLAKHAKDSAPKGTDHSDWASVRAVAQAMNAAFENDDPTYRAVCRAFHGAPHMTTASAAQALGIDCPAKPRKAACKIG